MPSVRSEETWPCRGALVLEHDKSWHVEVSSVVRKAHILDVLAAGTALQATVFQVSDAGSLSSQPLSMFTFSQQACQAPCSRCWMDNTRSVFLEATSCQALCKDETVTFAVQS